MGNCFFLLASNLKCHNIRFVEKMGVMSLRSIDTAVPPCELLLVVTGPALLQRLSSANQDGKKKKKKKKKFGLLGRQQTGAI